MMLENFLLYVKLLLNEFGIVRLVNIGRKEN